MDSLDLNIENYEIPDILNLFSLQSTYDSDDLKQIGGTLFDYNAYNYGLLLNEGSLNKKGNKLNKLDLRNNIVLCFLGSTGIDSMINFIFACRVIVTSVIKY